jgi:hypothetical protein
MGAGVKNDQSYEAVLEDLLNAKQAKDRNARFEILNFAVGGYSLVNHAIVAENRLAPFDPDLVLLAVYSTEKDRLLSHIAGALENNTPIPFPELRDIIDRSGVKLWMSQAQIRNLLRPRLDEFADWSFRKLKAECEERGWPLVVLFLPTTTDKGDANAERNMSRLWQGATAAGLDSVRLGDVFGDYDISDIQLNRWDSHPNALGHQLIAARLYDFLVERQPQLFVKPDLAIRTGR